MSGRDEVEVTVGPRSGFDLVITKSSLSLYAASCAPPASESGSCHPRICE